MSRSRLGALLWFVVVAFSALPAFATEPSAQAPSGRQRTIAALLAEAEAALFQGRLTLPVHDNAYDRYQAVQLLDPNNQAARAGLHSILLVYTDRIQQALSTNRLQAAAAELRQAQTYFPNAELLRPLAQAVRQRSNELAKISPIAADTRERIHLPPQPLSQKNAEIKQLLTQVAQRVQQSDEAVIIYARSDAEGRWIYKTMKEAVAEYRIRGDIRITQKPAIVFQAPLEVAN